MADADHVGFPGRLLISGPIEREHLNDQQHQNYVHAGLSHRLVDVLRAFLQHL